MRLIFIFLDAEKKMIFDDNMSGRIWKVPTGQSAPMV